MSETYGASEFIADFSAAVHATKSVPDLETCWKGFAPSITRHGVRVLCADICKVRKVELSQPGDGGGSAA